MNYLINKLNIIHRDLKGANVFLNLLKNGKEIKLKAVIGDFGCALYSEEEKIRNECGTFRWKVLFK